METFVLDIEKHIRIWKNSKDHPHFTKHLPDQNHHPHSSNTPTVLNTISKSIELNKYTTDTYSSHLPILQDTDLVFILIIRDTTKATRAAKGTIHNK